MIVPMKKVLLLALKNEREAALTALRELGVVEVVSENLADSADRTHTALQLSRIDRMIGLLSTFKAVGDFTADPSAPDDCSDLAGYALSALAEAEAIERQKDALNKEFAQLAPWGGYDPELITDLQKKNIFVHLCEGSAEQFEQIAGALPANAAVFKLEKTRSTCRFAVISSGTLPAELLLPEVPPARRSLAKVQADMAENAYQQSLLQQRLCALQKRLNLLQNIRGQLASELELLTVRDGLDDCGQIVALRGFVPEFESARLAEAARNNAWALILDDPTADETPPVLLEPPRWVKPILPLFQFLGIAPGYNEFDMSPGMLIFFSIFFSMIINDAGYALIMLIAAVIAAVLLRKNPKSIMPCKLALVLSGCATLWGIANGAYFGTEQAPLEFFAAGENQTAHLQLVCFVLALVHLSLGHCWRLVNASSIREVIGQLGWIPILLLDFMVVLGLLVYPGMGLPAWSLWAGGAGLIMVLAGAVDWRDVGAICNFPFDLIGSFTDTLSYVRLFAVGMSGTYMAQSFNDMGMQLWELSPWLIPVALLVILFGHLLNVALAFMSVLVHGVRLNTLEFSNHAGIRWGGQPFKPLKKFEP